MIRKITLFTLPFFLHFTIFRFDEFLSLLIRHEPALSSSEPIFAPWAVSILLGLTLITYFYGMIYKGSIIHLTIFVLLVGVLIQIIDGPTFLAPYARPEIVNSKVFKDQVVLVTGANSGVGLAIAETVVGSGGRVYMGCRNLEKCEEARKGLMEFEKFNGGNATCVELDLGDFDSVWNFVEEFEKTLFGRHLDYLFSNAGFATPPPKPPYKTRQGLELGLGTMHFGHFLLTSELFTRKLLTHKDSTHVITSSAASQFTWAAGGEAFTNDIVDDLRGEITKTKSPMMYARAKLANLLFARESYYRWHIDTCACHIGAVSTRIWDVWPPLQPLVDLYTDLTFRTIESGSRILMRCALDESKKHGSYLDGMGYHRKDKSLSKESKDKGLSERLWRVSLEVVEDWKKGRGLKGGRR